MIIFHFNIINLSQQNRRMYERWKIHMKIQLLDVRCTLNRMTARIRAY